MKKHKLGLKLYSTNSRYFSEAAGLFAGGGFDFVELLPVPGSFSATAGLWRSLGAPFVIHAPHYSFGVNLGLREAEAANREKLAEAARFADELSARYIICHPGIESDIRETARQLRQLNDGRFLVENKPYTTTDGKLRCIGGTPDEIAMVMSVAGTGFCMDMGHGASYAVGLGRDPYSYLREFNALGPAMYHVSDGFIRTGKDTHEHIGSGDFDWPRIFSLIPDGALVTIETRKDSPESLADFRADALRYRELLAAWGGADLEVRPAEERDSLAVFELSNEPEVRKYSINPLPIPWEDHSRWFPARLSDPDCHFFIAEKGGGFAAQVRYQMEKRDLVVSISIASSFRGKGLAPAILKESARMVFAARPGLAAITAYIDPGNAASVRSFEKAGYGRAGTAALGGRVFSRYTLERKKICG